MASKWINTTSANEFVPKEDVIRKKDDGREIVLARAGTPLPMAKARQLGLVKDEKPEEKAEPPKNNKSAKPSENKGAEKPEEKGGEK